MEFQIKANALLHSSPAINLQNMKTTPDYYIKSY